MFAIKPVHSAGSAERRKPPCGSERSEPWALLVADDAAAGVSVEEDDDVSSSGAAPFTSGSGGFDMSHARNRTPRMRMNA